MKPRCILEGTTYMVTRRCTQRQLLLVPSQTVNDVFAYCLALAAQRTGIILHAACVLSNHWHGIVTDPHGRLPEFCHLLHGFVGKALNAHYGRAENLWDRRPPSYVRLANNEDVLRKLLYVLHNPVSAHLTDKGHHWPGLRLFPGEERIVAKPRVYFRQRRAHSSRASLGLLPDHVPLSLSAPSGFALPHLRQTLSSRLRDMEHHDRHARIQRGIPVLGRRAVRSQSPFHAPDSARFGRSLSPQLAAVDKWARIETLGQLDGFHSVYRSAIQSWQLGFRDVVFPRGTYRMRRLHNVTCAP